MLKCKNVRILCLDKRTYAYVFIRICLICWESFSFYSSFVICDLFCQIHPLLLGDVIIPHLEKGVNP
jgi:hypothetical protein